MTEISYKDGIFSVELKFKTDKPERSQKGSSLLVGSNDYAVLDIETTGLDPTWDSIIEIACIRVVSGDIIDSYQSLVNPGYLIDDFITELTGITNEMLASAPSLNEVIPQFLNFARSDIIVGHNVNFDINFIYDSCVNILNTVFTNDFIDTMRLSRRLFKEYQHHRLCDLVQHFGVDGVVEHRALSDAIKTHMCYEYMKKYVVDNEIEFASLYPVKNDVQLAKNIKTDINTFDETTSIFDKTFVFTGALNRMTRKEAMQLVVDKGGFCGDNVTKSTNYLVLGNNDYCTTIKGGKSNKQKKVEQLKLSGSDIDVISENVFYDMLSENSD